MRLLGVHGVGNLQLNCCWSTGQPWWSITCCQLLPKLATCDRIDGASLSLCHHLRFSQSKVQLFFGPWYCPWAKCVVTWALAYDSWLPKQTVKLWKVITPQRPPRSTVNRTRDGTIDSKIRESGESTITEIDSCSFCFFDHFFLNFCDVVRMDSLHATGSGPERVNGLQQLSHAYRSQLLVQLLYSEQTYAFIEITDTTACYMYILMNTYMLVYIHKHTCWYTCWNHKPSFVLDWH